jgi:transcriptional regulator with XRE-family HTH domain
MVLVSLNSYLQTDKEREHLLYVHSCMQKRMKDFRKKHGLQLEEVERLLDGKGTTSTWKRLEYSSKNFAGLLTLIKISNIIGISVSELLSPLPSEKPD